MPENIIEKERLTPDTPLATEDPSSSSTTESGEEYILSPSPLREASMNCLFPDPLAAHENISSPPLTSPMSLCPNSPDPLAPPMKILSASLSGYTHDGETCSLPSTPTSSPQQNSPPILTPPQEAPPNPIPITYHNFADIPAPPVHLYQYECKMCNVHLFIPGLVPGHLVAHKHPLTGEWICTSCGKRYIKGRWGYTMLVNHLQGRGGSACHELVDLRAQFAYMFGEAGIMSTFGNGAPM